MGIDIDALWDFRNPELSEQRFREALQTVESADERRIVETQIARTYGLRQEFDQAREILGNVRSELADAGTEVQARYWLELGRSRCSAAHRPEEQTHEARTLAHEAYSRAFECAQSGGHDGLAVDALHMLAMIDPTPEAQIAGNERALDFVNDSPAPAAKKWEGSLRNNLGYALHLAGRYDEALIEFERSRVLRQDAGNEPGERIARWMMGWTLRVMGRVDEALAIQLQLEEDLQAAGTKDPYVFQELEALYRESGETEKAEIYRAKQT